MSARNALWIRHGERGSSQLLRAMTFVSLRLGRRLSRVFLYGIAVYFFLFAPTARRVAIVRSDLQYGLFRMYELLSNSPEGRLTAVRTLDAAFDALEITAEGRRAVLSAVPDRSFDGGPSA